MNDGLAFCTKCGAKMAAVAPPAVATSGGAAAAAAPAQQQKSGGALKVVLIVIAVIAVLLVGGLAVAGYMVKRAVTNAVQTDSSGNLTSVNIGGTKIETLKDSRLVAQRLGVEIFPGAEADDTNSSSMTIGGVTTTHAQFSTSASPDEVFEFYKGKYPNANVIDQPESKTLMEGTEDKELLTINVVPEDGKTLIHLTHITKGK
jgi:Tfp pilus assembly major pilin PilA